MSFSSAQLIEKHPELQYGNTVRHAQANKLSSCDDYDPDSLVFCSSESTIQAFQQIAPAIIITTTAICNQLTDIPSCILISPNVRLSHALIKQELNDYDASDAEWPHIHPSAIIHDSASIGNNCRIGPNVVIGAHVSVGDHSIIRAGSVIEHDCQIGQQCIIHSLCNIGYGTTIGNRVNIHAGTIIGSEGFGLAQDEQQQSHRIPHTGTVIISDDVQIGSNCNIDRGTYGATQIGKGTKIDALCHVAHNVTVGENCLITAQCGIAGSSNIGNRVIMSGQTGVLDHKTIVDDAVLVHRCGVTKDITTKGLWAGTPPKPLKEYAKDQQLAKKIEKLKRQLHQLEQNLNHSE